MARQLEWELSSDEVHGARFGGQSVIRRNGSHDELDIGLSERALWLISPFQIASRRRA